MFSIRRDSSRNKFRYWFSISILLMQTLCHVRVVVTLLHTIPQNLISHSHRAAHESVIHAVWFCSLILCVVGVRRQNLLHVTDSALTFLSRCQSYYIGKSAVHSKIMMRNFSVRLRSRCGSSTSPTSHTRRRKQQQQQWKPWTTATTNRRVWVFASKFLKHAIIIYLVYLDAAAAATGAASAVGCCPTCLLFDLLNHKNEPRRINPAAEERKGYEEIRIAWHSIRS